MNTEQVEFFRVCSEMARAQADIANALRVIHHGELDLADAHRRYQAAKDRHESLMIQVHTSTPIREKTPAC